MANKNTINKRIIDIMKENWLSPLFFAAGIDVLKQKIDLLSDSDIYELFGGLMSPDFVRKELERIQTSLQNEQ